MERTIWLYWETPPGATEPPHITLCRETIRRNSGAQVVLLNEKNIGEYLPDVPPEVYQVSSKKSGETVSIPIKVGILRQFILERYGGLYLDSDAVVLEPLDEVFDAIEEHGFVCLRKTSRPQARIPNNFVGAKPGNPIIRMITNHLRVELSHRTHFEWGEVGAKSITPIVNGNLEHAFVFPEHRIHPVINNDQSMFARSDLRADDVIRDDTLVCMLFHGIFDEKHPRHQGKLADHSLWDLYYGNTLLADIYRRALSEEAFLSIPGARDSVSTAKPESRRILGFLPRGLVPRRRTKD